MDSDGTLIIYFGYPSGGTELTIMFCIQAEKPYLLIDAEELPVDSASRKIRAFVDKFDIKVLNVAGPRASKEPGAYAYAKNVVMNLLQ